jgi:hypothetical protein
VCLGTGTEGEAAYTLVRENNKITLYNACNGIIYDIKDTLSPLTDVACIFNNKNVSNSTQFLPAYFSLF